MPKKSPITVTIVGGTGGMGKLLTHFLTKHGIRVLVTGRDLDGIKTKVEQSDALLFSIPFAAFGDVVQKLAPLPLESKLLIDLSSNVSEHLPLLSKRSSHVAFIHLLFGPDIYTIKGQNIVASDISHEAFQVIIQSLQKEGAHIFYTSPKQHDQLMAIVQALSQFSTIVLAKTIADAAVDRKELDAGATLTFSLQADLISRIVGQSPELWSSIQFTNTIFPHLLKAHLKNTKLFASYVVKKDSEHFESSFKSLAAFWKDEKAIIAAQAERSRNVVSKNAVGILGPEGSYSQQALRQYNPKNKAVFFDSITEVIDALSLGKVEKAILPFENSIQGTVLETLDGLYRHHLKVSDEVVVDVAHVVAGLVPLAPHKVRTIYSHPQALAQSAHYLRAHFPEAKLVQTPSTSSAFKKIKDEQLSDALAVGPRLAAELYGLTILDEAIQDVKNNQTLFVVVSSMHTASKYPFSLYVVKPVDRPGVLHDLLGVFKKHKINLVKLESRPSREKLGQHIFYIKANLPARDRRNAGVVKELKAFGPVTVLT